MILESNITDESKVTFECAKATVGKGSRISIDDSFWREAEIQNAIKMGLVSLVGPEPVLQGESIRPTEHKIRFRNIHSSKLCFDSFKDYADPGQILWVPASKVDEPEVRNAIAYGFLTNEDDPASTPPRVHSGPAILEELTLGDIIMNPPKEESLPEGVPAKRPVSAKAGKIKAKKISSSSDLSGDDVEEPNDLLRESQVIMPPEKKTSKKKSMPAPPLIEDTPESDDDFDFTSAFSKGQPRNRK